MLHGNERSNSITPRGDGNTVLQALSSLGNALYWQGNYDEAFAYHQRAKAVAQHLKDIPAEVKVLYNYNIGANLIGCIPLLQKP